MAKEKFEMANSFGELKSQMQQSAALKSAKVGLQDSEAERRTIMGVLFPEISSDGPRYNLN